ASSAACHCASVAVAPEDVSVSTPVAALYEAAILPYVVAFVFVKASTSSPLWKLPVMAMVADASVGEAPSVRVSPESIATGVDTLLSPATNEAEPGSVVIVGGPSTSTVSVAAALVLVPSLVANEIVRFPGVAFDAAAKVTALNACDHCASDAVAPDEVSVNTPVAELYEPTMLPNVTELVLTKVSVSPVWKPPVIETVPADCVVLSRSLTVMPPSIVTAEVPPT